tara:strand:+ start:145 stop:660 length:516 start_codon:yes stop_codon:yes gene_type:complete
MNVYLLTHPASITFKDSFASLKEFGYDPIVINGYTRYDYLKPNEICYSSFRDKILPLAIESGCDLFYIEDDTILKEPLPEFNNKELVRVAYYGNTKSGVIGTNIVYINKLIYSTLQYDLENSISQHFDRYLSKFCKKYDIDDLNYQDFKWGEKIHTSAIVDKVRKHKRVLP